MASWTVLHFQLPGHTSGVPFSAIWAVVSRGMSGRTEVARYTTGAGTGDEVPMIRALEPSAYIPGEGVSDSEVDFFEPLPEDEVFRFDDSCGGRPDRTCSPIGGQGLAPGRSCPGTATRCKPVLPSAYVLSSILTPRSPSSSTPPGREPSSSQCLRGSPRHGSLPHPWPASFPWRCLCHR
ncbi:MAG: hypothetical protein RLZZ165_2253 [Bacteroidota bacterium]